MTVWRVREAHAGEAARLAEFNIAMARETESLMLPPARVEAGVRAVFEDPARGFYLVAEPDAQAGGELAAALLITREWSDWRNAWFWWIQSVYVVPEWRRQGAFRALYDAVVARAGTAGNVCGLRLYVERDNRDARETYDALGMERSWYRMYERTF
jgi:GNAT superfamily N-acetyltransferase